MIQHLFSGLELLNKTAWIIYMFIMNTVMVIFYITIVTIKRGMIIFLIKEIIKTSLSSITELKLHICLTKLPLVNLYVIKTHFLYRWCRMDLHGYISPSPMDDRNYFIHCQWENRKWGEKNNLEFHM